MHLNNEEKKRLLFSINQNDFKNEQKNIDTYIEKTNSELSNSKVIANLRTIFKEE